MAERGVVPSGSIKGLKAKVQGFKGVFPRLTRSYGGSLARESYSRKACFLSHTHTERGWGFSPQTSGVVIPRLLKLSTLVNWDPVTFLLYKLHTW